MGEVIIRTVRGMNWMAKISLVLVFTLVFSTFMHQGWYKPKSAAAAITVLTPWSNIHNATTAPGTLAYPITSTGLGARMLVVAVSGTMTAASATRSITLTYGGQSMTKAATNETTSARTHTWLFYLQETGIQAATNSNLVFTITNPGTTRFYQVDAAVYDAVDQSGTPISSNQSYLNDGTAANAIGPFAANLVVGTGDTAVEIVSVVRYASATPRTVSTWAASWSSLFGPTTLASTDSINVYIATDTTAGNTTSQHTASNTTNCSMSAMSIKAMANTLTVGNGTNPASANAGQGTVNNPLDAFTMVSAGISGVNSVTFTGSANFTTANIAGINVYRDNGTLGVLDSADVLVPSTYSPITANVTTITFTTPEVVRTTPVNYLVVVDIAAAATTGQTFTGTVTAAAGNIGTPTYGDTSSATLTIQSPPGLTVGNGTNPANGNAQISSVNNALDGFTLQTANALGGTAAIDTLTVTGSANFTSANIADVHVYADNGTVGTFDGADILLPSTASPIVGNATTLTFTPPIYVTNTAKNYLVVVDITAGATVLATFTGTVTAATGHGLATPTYGDTSSATLTIKLASTTTSCGSCHAYPPLDSATRNSPAGAVFGSHQKHKFICSTCHVAPATETSADYGHRNSNIQMNTGSTGISGGFYDKANTGVFASPADETFAQTNSGTTRSCRNISCHNANNPTPQWGVGLGSAGCVTCHNGSVPALNASRLSGGTVTQRDNVVGEFGLAYGHRNATRTAANGGVTDADCIVCHIEGDYSTGRTSAKHADGYIDLRDPDNTAHGNGEVPIDDMSGNPFRFVQFATSYAAGSRTSTGHLSNNIDNVVTQKFCLACHDSNGATNTAARSNNGGTGAATMPFGGINLGANYTVLNGAAVAGGLIDVKTQFALTNSSRHPVLGPLNRDFPYSTRLVPPYNNIGTARDANSATTHVLADSVVLNCFDCHNSNTTLLTTRTISAHGTNNTAQVRGTFYVNSPTLCTACHVGYTSAPGSTSQHGTGSAGVWGGNSGEATTTVCTNCHSSQATLPARPRPAADYHGFNALASGGLWPAQGGISGRPFAFIRGWTGTAWHRPYRSTEWTTGSATCGNGTCPDGQAVGDGANRTYTPGGTY